MALEPPHAILPANIPPRTSSHQRSSSASQRQDNPISPTNVPHRRSSKRPMSGGLETEAGSGSWLSSGKLPVGPAGMTANPYRPQSSHFPASSSSTAAYGMPGAPSSKSHSKSPPKPHANPLGMHPPAPDPPSDYGDKFIKQGHATWSAEKENILMGPFDYLYGHPGKDIRAQLIAAFNAWLRVPEPSLAIITKVVGMLHTASLLVDDVEDSSLLRRGVPVANSIFGTPQTINSANYVYFLALQQLTLLNNPLTLQIYTEELLNLHRGQGMDLYWRDTLTCPTEDDYLEMVSNKTGGLFRLAIKLMQAESPVIKQSQEAGSGPIDCVPLVSTIGLLFQILDDFLNLSSPSYTQRKGLCEDLTEGKFSFPVLHAIRADPSNLVLLNILKQKTSDEEVKRYAVAYMERMGSFDYCRKVTKVLEGKAVVMVGELERKVGGETGREGAEGIRRILGRLKAL